MPSGSSMNWLNCQGKEKVSWVQGWLRKLLILKSPWSTWAWTHQSAWQKTSWFAWKLHFEWWHTLRHVACGQATGDRRGQDAPVLPMRGRWSRLRHVWASNQWKNSIRSMDYGSGSKRFSGTKNSWREQLFKTKGQRVSSLGSLFSQEMIQHLLPIPQLNITSSWHRNPSITVLLQSLSCCELRAKGICRIRFWGSGNL